MSSMGRAGERRPRRWWLRVILLLLTLLGTLSGFLPGARTAHAVPSTVYFPETGHHVSDHFLTYWRGNGGLPIFGYPLTEPIDMNGMLVQYFERARFEFHAELVDTPHVVQLELLGNEMVAGRTDPAFGRIDLDSDWRDTSDRRYFGETGHFLAYGFKTYWESYGGLPVFGFPISEEFSENGHTVQYFERARFEFHPEHAGTRYEVLLGRLGADAAERDDVSTAAVPRQDGVPDYAPSLFIQSIRLPVLMYHRFGPASRYVVPYARFGEQLDWLKNNGYTTVTLDQVYDFMFGDGSLPAKPIVLTFDDGDASQWDAAAMLDARGMKGVFFIIGGSRSLADWQLRSLVERGHEIGSHSMSHPSMPGLSDAGLAYETSASKQRLEAITGRPVAFFAYPYGDYDGRSQTAVRAAGYRGGIAAWGGDQWTPEKRWHEPRIEISGYLSLPEFVSYVR